MLKYMFPNTCNFYNNNDDNDKNNNNNYYYYYYWFEFQCGAVLEIFRGRVTHTQHREYCCPSYFSSFSV